jgi:Spy/CpxP family protein refolding chaperone
MLRIAIVVAGWWCCFVAVGQQMPPGPPARPMGPGAGPQRPPGQEPGLQGEKKLHWVCRHLKLDDKQQKQVDDLFTVYDAQLKEMQANAGELMQKIQDKFAELQAARNEGNQERVQRLQDELRNMAPDRQTENQFFEGLDSVLTPEQKAKLAGLLARAEAGGEVAIRPVHVLREARKLKLTADQDQKLEKVLDDYRTLTSTSRPSDPDVAEQRVEQFVADVRAVLTPDQAKAFDQQMQVLRDTPPPLPPPVESPVSPPPNRPPTVPHRPQ